MLAAALTPALSQRERALDRWRIENMFLLLLLVPSPRERGGLIDGV